MFKIIIKFITIIAVNLLAWDFFVSNIFILLGLIYDSNLILFCQVATIILSLLAWLWVHYSPPKQVAAAKRYEL